MTTRTTFKVDLAERDFIARQAARELEVAGGDLASINPPAKRREAARTVAVMNLLLSDIGYELDAEGVNDSQRWLIGEHLPAPNLRPWLERWTNFWGDQDGADRDDELHRLSQQLEALKLWHRMLEERASRQAESDRAEAEG